MTVIESAKEYLPDERMRIKLHDLVAQETRRVISVTSEEAFPSNSGWSEAAFADRLGRYNEALAELAGVETLIGYWGQELHASVLTLAPRQLAGRMTGNNGIRGWLGLRWYGVQLLIYSGGIAAVAAENYHNLKKLLLAVAPDTDDRRKSSHLVLAVVAGLQDVQDGFKTLPEHKNHHVPLSEYLFSHLRAQLDDLLLLGADYEACFDRFEVMLALVHADLAQWGRMLGRFAWKHSGRTGEGPLQAVMADAERQHDAWPPLQCGLFSGRYERFKEVAEAFSTDIAKLHWF